MMKGFRIVILILIFASTGVAYAYTIQTTNKGAETIELNGGKSGPVPFPHLTHQQSLTDCKVCHELFPQELGAIDKLKASGELKKKHVMNKHCTRCHKKMKTAGEKTGPTTCKSCHIKK